MKEYRLVGGPNDGQIFAAKFACCRVICPVEIPGALGTDRIAVAEYRLTPIGNEWVYQFVE